jgi:hypothetical protein
MTSNPGPAGSIAEVGRKESGLTLIPKDWSIGAVFSPVKQTAPREISVNGNRWRMGIPNPLTNEPSKPIDMSHVQLLFAVLSFFFGDNPISMSMKELARRSTTFYGGKSLQRLRKMLNELRDYWISCEHEGGRKRMFPAISRVDLSTRVERRVNLQPGLPLGIENPDDFECPAVVQSLRLENITLAEEFVEFLSDFANVMHLRLDVLRSMPSPIAQAIYLYLPSRAVHHSGDQPFRIGLVTLFKQLGMSVPPNKSLRKKVLVQHENSVIKQLNHASILSGKLRVTLRLNRDQSDYNFEAWVEREQDGIDLSNSDSKLVQAWRQSGRPEKELTKLLRAPLQDLTGEDAYLCEAAQINLKDVERFFQIAKVVLHTPRIQRILADVKVGVVEGRVKNPTGVFIYRVLDAISQPPEGSAKSTAAR